MRFHVCASTWNTCMILQCNLSFWLVVSCCQIFTVVFSTDTSSLSVCYSCEGQLCVPWGARPTLHLLPKVTAHYAQLSVRQQQPTRCCWCMGAVWMESGLPGVQVSWLTRAPTHAQELAHWVFLTENHVHMLQEKVQLTSQLTHNCLTTQLWISKFHGTKTQECQDCNAVIPKVQFIHYQIGAAISLWFDSAPLW